MILPIYLYGQPVLHNETEDIEPDYPEVKKLIADMFETMYHSAVSYTHLRAHETGT